MKDSKIERPKVTRVTITVKTPVLGTIITEIELEADLEINEANFPYWPTILLRSNEFYKIPEGTDREWNNSPETVTYVIPGLAIEESDVDVMVADVALELDACAYGYVVENSFN